MSAYATESITVDATAGGKAFTEATLNITDNAPESAVFVVETAEIRFTLDGTPPTTTVGTLGSIGVPFEITGESNMRKFRAIRTGAVSGVIQPIYFDGNS